MILWSLHLRLAFVEMNLVGFGTQLSGSFCTGLFRKQASLGVAGAPIMCLCINNDDFVHNKCFFFLIIARISVTILQPLQLFHKFKIK